MRLVSWTEMVVGARSQRSSGEESNSLEAGNRHRAPQGDGRQTQERNIFTLGRYWEKRDTAMGTRQYGNACATAANTNGGKSSVQGMIGSGIKWY